MILNLGELIARYEIAQDRVVKLVESAPESDSALLDADKALSTAFDQIMSAQLRSPEEVKRRVRFLLDQVRMSQPGNQLISILTDRIWRDVEDCGFLPTVETETPSGKVAGQK